jgi:flagellin
MAMNTYRQLGMSNTMGSKAMEKLSSGLRINRAGDDAAGLAISEKMRGQIRGLNQASRNAQDGISMIQTAEGALNETHSILQRMRELSVQASNETMEDEDRTAIGEELLELKNEIDRISDDTEFNGKKLLNGSLSTTDSGTGTVAIGDLFDTTTAVTDIDVSGADASETYTFSYTAGTDTLTLTGTNNGLSENLVITAPADGSVKTYSFDELGVSISFAGAPSTDLDTFGAAVATGTIITAAGTTSATLAIGANEGQTMDVSFADMGSDQLGDSSDLNTLIADNSSVSTVAKAQNLITELDGAIVDVSTQRGKFGAAQNRLEHTIKNLDTSSENLQASESRIRDVDMAKEMMEFTKNNILQQAAQAMLAQANSAPQGVLQLLR